MTSPLGIITPIDTHTIRLTFTLEVVGKQDVCVQKELKDVPAEHFLGVIGSFLRELDAMLRPFGERTEIKVDIPVKSRE